MGISSFNFACTPGVWPEFGNATMEIDSSGRIVVRAGISELGQGSRTALAQIAAQALGVPIDHVAMARFGDTAVEQDSLQTTSSRGTINAGNAIINAAKEARQVLCEMAADLMEVNPDQVAQTTSGFCQVEGGRTVSFGDLLLYCYKCGRRLLGKGWWCVPKAKVDPETGLGNPYHIFAYGTQVIEVEVDTATGQVEVKRVVAAQDVGKAINPALVEAQMQGGVVMGLGFALSEEIRLDRGKVENSSFANYLVPTASDIPEIIPILVEDAYPNGPFGAKGVGEPGAVATAAAIANAVYDAIGVRITQLPITAERVWQALQEKNRSAAAAK
jgi:CO/xanthine dehydrogenase Mo-binding subunit